MAAKYQWRQLSVINGVSSRIEGGWRISYKIAYRRNVGMA